MFGHYTPFLLLSQERRTWRSKARRCCIEFGPDGVGHGLPGLPVIVPVPVIVFDLKKLFDLSRSHRSPDLSRVIGPPAWEWNALV